jgi:hypothetical protein
MSRHLEFPRALSWDRDYWLCRCEGFRVDAPTGRLGLVESVRFSSRLDRPDELLVRTGILGNRLLVVAVSDVEAVIPRRERLVLRSGPERATHRLARLRFHVHRT